jgi:hypothetical protein
LHSTGQGYPEKEKKRSRRDTQYNLKKVFMTIHSRINMWAKRFTFSNNMILLKKRRPFQTASIRDRGFVILEKKYPEGFFTKISR